jgi:hypothetical protein
MTIHALDKNFLIKEVPIGYRDRCEGSESKLSTVSDGAKVLRTIAELFRDYRPLAFFGGVAVILGVISIVMFLIPFNEYVQTGYVRKVPTLVVSIALGISAMLSLVCGVLLESIRNHARQFYELALNALPGPDDSGCRR